MASAVKSAAEIAEEHGFCPQVLRVVPSVLDMMTGVRVRVRVRVWVRVVLLH